MYILMEDWAEKRSRQKGRQRGDGTGIAAAHSFRHTEHGHRHKTQTLLRDVPSGMPAKGGSGLKQERDKPSHGSHDRDTVVQWSEDVVKADPFFRRSRVRFRVAPWVSNTIARDHLA